ncbi:MAG TPA: 4-hydroxybenzoate octaprenyltransferase [Oceanospirillaceae bacterium]|jgi:4-hydroxybenzoate polyprenyltransferase|nr:4-hydroxybenzoate octaprenyltransferase [Oceanospirillaceae bacterium]
MSLISNWPAYKQLMRLDKPVGTYLLLWPTLWALWLAAEGLPEWHLLFIFIAGVYLMRAAGCVINDYADRHIDGHVERTQQRPLATGQIDAKAALRLFASLCLLAFMLVLFTNTLTILLSFVGVALAALYPFMKRYTHWPQLVLGLAFSWAIPMAFSAQTGGVPMVAWLAYIAVVLMTIAYDTYYAMVDRNDDLLIGVKSTAVLFGQWDRHIIVFLQLGCLLLLTYMGQLMALGVFFYGGLVVMASLFVYQAIITRKRDRDACFKAFLNNHWASLAVWIGLVIEYW